MSAFFKTFLSDEGGATAIEYGLIASLISVAIILTLISLGQNLDATFQAVRDNLVVSN